MSDQPFSERSPSPSTRAAPHSSMAEAMSAGRSPGLIRRISRGAHNRLRRRASTNHSLRMRDQSAGPVLVRRRSDSNGASDFAQDVSDLDLDSTAEDAGEDAAFPSSAHERTNALGINVGRPSIAPRTTSIFEGGIAPASSAVLENGTWLTKITKRNTKRIKLWLDSSSARVCWHSSKPNKSFFVDDVREVRVGVESRNARDDVQIPEDQEGRWVTIVYDVPERSKGRAIKTMHIIMPDDYILKLWTEALNIVTRERIEIMNALASSPEKSEKSMTLAWSRVMARKSAGSAERFSLDDARWLCRKLEINCTDSAVKTHFKAVASDEAAGLDHEQYRNFVRSFRERKDIQYIYRNIKFGTDLDMDLTTFLDFLKTEQAVDVVKERAHWESVFDKYSRPSQNKASLPDAEHIPGQRTLNMQSFQNFLTSSHCSPLIQRKGEPTTLDRPLNEYFISSSHNTYLLGRQVAGASSVEGYIAALVKGCRCVEIDCWDGDDGRPMVTHGRTMTTKIPFEDCVSVVAKYAFNSTPYPLIVSLEVHCSPEQQLAMVDLMKTYFHTMMVTEPIVPNSSTLPSPEELKNRILIKVKAAPEHVDQSQLIYEATNGRSRARSLTQSFNRTPSMENHSTVSSPLVSSSVATSPSEYNAHSTPRGSITSGPTATPSSSADDSDDVPASADRMRKNNSNTSRIHTELGKLGVYSQGIKFNGFSAPDARTFNHVYSFNENTFEKHFTKVGPNNKALLEKHNMKYLMRVYPGARRIDSSNFNPLQSWRRGVQMAALNWQTYDVHQQVNEAMFAAGSDRLGYVLKPEELRHAKHLPIADTVAEAPEKKEKKGKKLVKFSVDIISALRLPRPRNQTTETGGMNPYIEFEMYSAEDKARGIATAEGGTDASARDGSSGIGSPLRKRTRIIEGNGFDPQYNQTITLAVETKYPSLIFVRWTVWNSPEGKNNSSNSVLLATFTAKFDSLQQGFRHLPLFNPQGEQYRDAKLFVKIKKEAPISLSNEDNAYGIMDLPYANGTGSHGANSPRPTRPTENVSRTGGWPRRIFSRSTSMQRKNENGSGAPSRTSSTQRAREGSEIGGPMTGYFSGELSRTSSMERELLK
ncbi:unnamed protein product [Zymoseptoria tritici ST99CH_3D7]|uniref:Phosphoinositide phospholipase C n=3 Tax=Zymoseptoria tritici TaxID=1047171 RepID=A0A1X7RG52_ZYMT9|nr:unnamed protein product [Zymoseptoria tritici ST99CH_3D7]SMR42334.1 unnamed protein product [Zymoseptoria tritici ST99CH_1E4]